MSGQFPQSLWRPSPKDLNADFNPQAYSSGVQPQPNTDPITATWGRGPGNVVNALPIDKLLVVTYLSAALVCGGATTIFSLEWRISDATSGQRIAVIDHVAFASGLGYGKLSVPVGELIVSPLNGLMVVADVSAADAATQLFAGVHGYLIPRGNWQLP